MAMKLRWKKKLERKRVEGDDGWVEIEAERVRGVSFWGFFICVEFVGKCGRKVCPGFGMKKWPREMGG